MDLFEYRNVIFDKEKFSKVEDSIRKKHYFMLLRFFSIRYPVEASQLSQVPYNIGTKVIHSVLSRSYTGRLPAWVYTKGNTSKEDKKDPLSSISKEAKDLYAQKIEADTKDIILLYSSPTEEDIRKLKNIQSYLDK